MMFASSDQQIPRCARDDNLALRSVSPGPEDIRKED